MCQRRTDEKGNPTESWVMFVLRWCLETVRFRPSAFLTFFCCAAMAWMYYSTTEDARESRDKFLDMFDKQVQVMVEVSKQLSELNTRVQYLEKQK